MQKKLRLFIGTASVSVALIIGLQLFWIVSLFLEEKQRFVTDVKNAMMESVVVANMNVIVLNEPDTFNKALTNTVRNSVLSGDKEQLKKQLTDLAQKYSPDTRQSEIDSVINVIQSLDSTHVTMNLGNVVPTSIDGNIPQQQQYLQTALTGRSITLPFELGITDATGKLVDCSTDTTSFKKMYMIRLDYDGNKMSKAIPTQIMVLGFNGVNIYILQKMLWLLILSVVFIPLFVYSYIYVLRTFFRQKKMAEIRNDFMNNMTHELKTPISGASIAIELLRDNDNKEKKAEYIQIAQNELKRLTGLVEKVLNMAAFDKEEISLALETVILYPFINETINNVQPLLNHNNASIRFDVTPQYLATVADRFHLQNVIINLIDNAIKYNDKPKPQIDIQISQQGKDVVILVADNGKGIPAAYTDKIFDQFFRVPSGDLHDVKGYGLGLSYVKAIVTLHKGTITANSQEGIGSTFIITLPQN